MDKAWYLESIASDGSRLSTLIDRFPFRVGRDEANELTVKARGLSRHHAQIERDAQGGLRVIDLGSTNGTFVNRERIDHDRLLSADDVIHFGHAEFHLAADGFDRVTIDDATMVTPIGRTLSAKFVRNERQFLDLLKGNGLAAAVQPIVDATTGSVFAYELLGRCTRPDLPGSPMELFQLAAALDREVELSDAFRTRGFAAVAAKMGGVRLFVNTHPKETFAESFFASLARLRAQQGAPELVVEVPETAVMEVDRMRYLAARLSEIDVQFAYDDFGAGQARLKELGEVPAHFVKFDIGLVRGIHEAGERKMRVVRDLVRLVSDLGSVPLAEGVELEAEAATCREMGFHLIQGYLTGRPVLV